MDDTDLLEAIGQRRDEDAFTELCRRYVGRLCAFVRGRGIDDAEAVVQEVMITIWRRADSFDSARAAPSTWIFTIARNRATDQIRKHGRPTPDPRDPAFVATQVSTSAPAPDTAAEQGRQMAAIQRAMAELPPEQRELLALVYIRGMTSTEAATTLGIPSGTAKSRIRLALGRVRALLSEGSSHG